MFLCPHTCKVKIFLNNTGNQINYKITPEYCLKYLLGELFFLFHKQFSIVKQPSTCRLLNKKNQHLHLVTYQEVQQLLEP